MPTIDDFIRPKEWVSDFLIDLGKVIRKWGEETYMPIRQQVDEDWHTHKIVPPRNMELLIEFGPKFCGDELYVGSLVMIEPAVANSISSFESEYLDE